MKNIIGDILLLSDRRMAEVISCESAGLVRLQFVDKEEYSLVEAEKLNLGENLGNSRAVRASYYAARSVHLRLNRMNKI